MYTFDYSAIVILEKASTSILNGKLTEIGNVNSNQAPERANKKIIGKQDRYARVKI